MAAKRFLPKFLFREVSKVGIPWRKPHHSAQEWRRTPLAPSHLYPASLVREITREIHNLFFRIRDLRCNQLHRRGVLMDPLRRTLSTREEQNSARESCSVDMRNLYKFRPHTTLIESELFSEAWALGAEWAFRNSGRRFLSSQQEPSISSTTGIQ